MPDEQPATSDSGAIGMTTPKTIAGRVPFIELSILSGRPAGEVWISDRRGAALNKVKGTWDGWVLCGDYYWPNREAAKAYIDEHADKPERPAVTIGDGRQVTGNDRLGNKTPWEFACCWYTPGEIAYGIARQSNGFGGFAPRKRQS